VDIGKNWIDYGLPDKTVARSATDEAGLAELVAFCKKHNVERVGLEATGSYARKIAEALRAAGLVVIVWQPRQIRAYAQFRGLKAKTDRIDAVLIAICTQNMGEDKLRDAPDPRLASLAEHLTRIDQITEDIARNKTRREHVSEKEILMQMREDLKRLMLQKREAIKALVKKVRVHDDLASKLDLLFSIQGIGEPTALMLVIRMPELGKITREEAASLLGVAPFDHESGQCKGQRRTGAGRTSLFAAVQAAARQWNPQLIAFYDRLIAKGKHHNTAIIACTRKMIIYANTVLAQNRAWEATT
jgi:transposase